MSGQPAELNLSQLQWIKVEFNVFAAKVRVCAIGQRLNLADSTVRGPKILQ